MTTTEILAQLKAYLPPGLAPKLGPDLLGFLEVVADRLKARCADLADRLRQEASPLTCEQMLPDWEAAFGLTETTISRFGSVAARQAQLVSQWRAHSSLSIPDLRALLQPFLLYADPTQIQILEADRAALKAAHTYPSNDTFVVIPIGFPGVSTTFTVKDDGPLSEAGAQLRVKISGYLEELDFTLVGPDGGMQQGHWPAGYLGRGQVLQQEYMLYAPTGLLFGAPPQQTSTAGNTGGTWALLIYSTGPHPGTLHEAGLFVESVGRNARGGEGLGCAVHEFAVVVDQTLLGAGADLYAARQMLERAKGGWTRAGLLKKNAVMGGGLLAIPDEPTTLPEESIPG